MDFLWEGAKIGMIPAVFIVVAGEIHLDGIFWIPGFVFSKNTINSKSRSFFFSYFFRHFKQELGITPYEFIISEKMKYAKKLLTKGNYSITDVSSMLSFGSTSYFVRHFRSFTGMTPLKYKQQFISGKGRS